MEKEIFLSVIVPAYNEEKRIGATLAALKAYFAKKDFTYEVIVVSGASADKTVAMVRDFAREFPGLSVIDQPVNKGKGDAVKEGMLHAKGNYRLFMDADNSVPVDYFDTFLPYFSQGYDVVIGSIEIAGAKIEEHAAWYRRALGHWAKLLIRALAIWEIHDTQRGFKVFSARAAEDIFPAQTLNRWGFDIEILVIAKTRGYRIKEVPVVWTNAGDSKVGLDAYITTLKDLLVVRKNMIMGKYKK